MMYKGIFKFKKHKKTKMIVDDLPFRKPGPDSI